MSDINNITKLNDELRLVIREKINDFAKLSDNKVRYMEFGEKLSIKVDSDGLIYINFSVSAIVDKKK